MRKLIHRGDVEDASTVGCALHFRRDACALERIQREVEGEAQALFGIHSGGHLPHIGLVGLAGTPGEGLGISADDRLLSWGGGRDGRDGLPGSRAEEEGCTDNKLLSHVPFSLSQPGMEHVRAQRGSAGRARLIDNGAILS